MRPPAKRPKPPPGRSRKPSPPQAASGSRPGDTSTARRLEIVLAVISAGLVLAMVGFLLRAAFFVTPSPAALSVAAAPADNTGVIRFTVRNAGGKTAANVRVSLLLRDGALLVDRRTVTIDYVPAHSEIGGGLILPPDARSLDRAFVVEGYMDP